MSRPNSLGIKPHSKEVGKMLYTTAGLYSKTNQKIFISRDLKSIQEPIEFENLGDFNNLTTTDHIPGETSHSDLLLLWKKNVSGFEFSG